MFEVRPFRCTASTLAVAAMAALSLPTIGHAQDGAAPEIIGGSVAPDGRYPWLVPLIFSNDPDNKSGLNCGASLISPKHVLTAAHCAGPQYDVLVGSQNLRDGKGKRIRVVKTTVHPDYHGGRYENDVAVLELAREVTEIMPVHYMTNLKQEAKHLPPGTMVTTAGWGDTAKGAFAVKHPTELMEVNVPMVDREVCNRKPAYPGEISESEQCAGYAQGGKDSCQGDSGGPLFVKGSGPKRDAVVGVVSWGEGCAKANKPGVYSRLAVLGAWVRQQVRAAGY